jgi:hypothetical protein
MHAVCVPGCNCLCAAHWLSHCTITPTASQLRAKGARISDEIVGSKARALAEAAGITDFKASHGWLQKFKDRYGIKRRYMHGESGSASEESIRLAREAVPAIIEELELGPDDVYNADETGLFFRAHPNKTLATEAVRGQKRAMDRITALLCTNVSGSDKHKPLLIHKSKKPRCFGKVKTLIR